MFIRNTILVVTDRVVREDAPYQFNMKPKS